MLEPAGVGGEAGEDRLPRAAACTVDGSAHRLEQAMDHHGAGGGAGVDDPFGGDVVPDRMVVETDDPSRRTLTLHPVRERPDLGPGTGVDEDHQIRVLLGQFVETVTGVAQVRAGGRPVRPDGCPPGCRSRCPGAQQGRTDCITVGLAMGHHHDVSGRLDAFRRVHGGGGG